MPKENLVASTHILDHVLTLLAEKIPNFGGISGNGTAVENLGNAFTHVSSPLPAGLGSARPTDHEMKRKSKMSAFSNYSKGEREGTMALGRTRNRLLSEFSVLGPCEGNCFTVSAGQSSVLSRCLLLVGFTE